MKLELILIFLSLCFDTMCVNQLSESESEIFEMENVITKKKLISAFHSKISKQLTSPP